MKQLLLALTLLSTTIAEMTATDFAGKSGKELLVAVAQSSRPNSFITHSIGDDGLWHAFSLTDNNGDGTVRDRFSTTVKYFSERNLCPTGMSYVNIAPSYWWNASESAVEQGVIWDLHNIVPCETEVKSLKSYYIPGEPETVSYSNECWSIGLGTYNGVTTTMFAPPRGYEGDFARVIMYMAVMYPWDNHTGTGCWMLSDEVYPALSRYSIKMLLKWANEDPVDDTERERNNAVEKLQGNRNPFVDNPELIDYLWGDKAGEVYKGVVTEENSQREDLKSVYSISKDSYVELISPWVPEDAQWSIDGTYYSERAETKALGAGMHEVIFTSATMRGKIMIKIEQ